MVNRDGWFCSKGFKIYQIRYDATYHHQEPFVYVEPDDDENGGSLHNDEIGTCSPSLEEVKAQLV